MSLMFDSRSFLPSITQAGSRKKVKTSYIMVDVGEFKSGMQVGGITWPEL